MDVAATVGASAAQAAGSTPKSLYADLFGSLKVSQSGLTWYELNRLGLLYTIGFQDTALTSLGATATGLTTTATPTFFIFNPLGSGIDIVMLKTRLQFTKVGATATNPKHMYYVTGSAGNNPISTGTKGAAINCKTLLAQGSLAVTAVTGAVALTGLVGSAVVVGPVGIPPVINATGPATAVTLTQLACDDMLEGSIIVKQGQFLGVMSQIDTSAQPSDVAGAFWWAELPTVA